jgi:hypothetical protein
MNKMIIKIKPAVEQVPSVVSMRQARLALLQADLLQHIEPTIQSLPSPQKEAAEIEWEYSQEIAREQPLVKMMAQALQLDEAALNGLFIAASKL